MPVGELAQMVVGPEVSPDPRQLIIRDDPLAGVDRDKVPSLDVEAVVPIGRVRRIAEVVEVPLRVRGVVVVVPWGRGA
jgi:hypothetical protein